MPAVSVLMGVLCPENRVMQLERAVASVLEQTFSDFELLICDDGSCVEAQTLLDRLATNDGRIRLVRQGSLLSLPCKLNACLAQSTGSWIARMDDDDFSHRERFQTQVNYLLAHPELSFVGCNVNLTVQQKPKSVRVLPQRPTVKDFLFVMPYVHPALMFNREALEAVGGYSEDSSCVLCEDYDLLLRLYEKGCYGGNIQEVLFDYAMDGVQTKRRAYRYRVNEAVTRWSRFSALGLMPKAFPYVIKPLLVGLLPLPILNRLKRWRTQW